VPEIFNYWLQGGWIDVGFLGAAQIDAYGNLNSTVIGDYARPKVRLPGAGGAPEIATRCRETIVMLRQTPRSFVERLDFLTSVGRPHGSGSTDGRDGAGAGVSCVVTDRGVLEPDGETGELVLAELHPDVTPEEAQEATGWELRIATEVRPGRPPAAEELEALRALKPANGDTVGA
jgi:glutaconate CoA-transferase subunit B